MMAACPNTDKALHPDTVDEVSASRIIKDFVQALTDHDAGKHALRVLSEGWSACCLRGLNGLQRMRMDRS